MGENPQTEPTDSALALGTRLLSVLVAYTLIDRLIRYGVRLDETSYSQASMATQLILHIVHQAVSFPVMTGTLGIALLVVLGWKWTPIMNVVQWATGSWNDMGISPAIRWVVIVACIVLAWSYASYDYNYYLNRDHLADRLILVALAISVVWRPILVFPFHILVRVVLGQFSVGLEGHPWATSSLLLCVSLVFGATILAGAFRRKWDDGDFVLLLMCVIAAHYFWSGLGKTTSGWMFFDQVHLLLPNTYGNGWFSLLSPTTVSAVARALSTIDVPVRVFTLALEVGVVLLVWNRRLAASALVGLLAMHIGIFLYSGILFWKWAVLEVAILFFILRGSRFDLAFSKARLVLSIPIVLASGVIFNPPKLAWVDSPMNYSYRFQAVGESGRTYEIPIRFFSPYDFQFTSGVPKVLVEQPRARIRWGATDRETYFQIIEAARDGDPLRVEQTAVDVPYDSSRANRLTGFVQRFVLNRIGSNPNQPLWSFLSAPRDYWTFPSGPVYDEQEPVDSIRIAEKTTFFDGMQYTVLRDQVIATIPLQRPAPVQSGARP